MIIQGGYLQIRLLSRKQSTMPHSHPVLTINTRHKENKLVLFSTLLHEQIHWFAVKNFERVKRIILELKKIYINVPVGYPLGAKDEFSTYLHLVINFLEIQALNELLNKKDANNVIDFLINDHYTWIYKTVLQDYSSLERLLIKNKVIL
jgi:hypothetical protein